MPGDHCRKSFCRFMDGGVKRNRMEWIFIINENEMCSDGRRVFGVFQGIRGIWGIWGIRGPRDLGLSMAPRCWCIPKSLQSVDETWNEATDKQTDPDTFADLDTDTDSDTECSVSVWRGDSEMPFSFYCIWLVVWMQQAAMEMMMGQMGTETRPRHDLPQGKNYYYFLLLRFHILFFLFVHSLVFIYMIFFIIARALGFSGLFWVGFSGWVCRNEAVKLYMYACQGIPFPNISPALPNIPRILRPPDFIVSNCSEQ